MIRKLLYFSLIFITVSCGKKTREGIALVVNGHEIPSTHVMQTAELLRQSMISAFPEKAVEGVSAEMLAGAARQLIAHRVLLEEARQRGITADSTEIDSLYSSLRNRVPDQAAFERELTKMGETDSSLRAQISEGILLEKLMKKIFASSRDIDSQECRDFYENNKTRYIGTARVRASQIFMPYPDATGEADKQKLLTAAQTVLRQLRSGTTFADLAKKHSKGPGALDGGDIGWFKKGDLKAELEDPLFQLKKGGVSDVITTDIGLFILQKTDEESEHQLPFEEVVERIRFLLEIKERNRLVSSHIDSLTAKAKIEFIDTTLAHVPEGGMNILPGIPQ
jgi:parvulin-like peptidyl-prolyl isomerase